MVALTSSFHKVFFINLTKYLRFVLYLSLITFILTIIDEELYFKLANIPLWSLYNFESKFLFY